MAVEFIEHGFLLRVALETAEAETQRVSDCKSQTREACHYVPEVVAIPNDRALLVGARRIDVCEEVVLALEVICSLVPHIHRQNRRVD